MLRVLDMVLNESFEIACESAVICERCKLKNMKLSEK